MARAKRSKTEEVPAEPRIKIKPEPYVIREAKGVTPRLIPFADLTSLTCRWPYGDGSPFQFCGCVAAFERPYCVGHTELASR